MFERRDAGATTETNPDQALVRIDPTVFETLAPPTPTETPRIDRWLETWANGER